ncbi:MAG TPA: efflux RND transporter periplasmic adaptor subunit [Planctomycetota bacterium]|nr:efflux RND transporter periplasmic adaptor subunit [Planctomycetota bacterium]
MMSRLGGTLVRAFIVLALCTGAYVAGRSAPPHRTVAPDAPVAPVESSAPASDWCAEHGVPESKCTKCDPNLIPRFKAAGDWCEEHGFPESICPICRPTPSRPVATSPVVGWCAEHGLPEAKCPKCHPELVEVFKRAGDWCEAHGFPESACPLCHPQAPRPGFVQRPAFEPGTRVRLASAEIERAAGIEFAPAEESASAPRIECTARVGFDRSRLADENAPIPGIVRDVLVGLGQLVEKGQPLVAIESPHLGELRARLRGALARAAVARNNVERRSHLAEGGVSSLRELELAREELETSFAEAEALEGAIAIVGSSADASGGRYTLRSPIDGTVARLPVVLGRLVNESDLLVTVADTGTMWVSLDLRESDAFLARTGQPVEVRADGLPEHVFAGRIFWISPEDDPKTRTVEARAAVANADGLLRANMFARATVQVGAAGTAVILARDSVQRVRESWVVFVRLGAGVYEPRAVALGGDRGGTVEILGNVRPGEPIVTTGAFLLKTELMKESLGAGCCDDDRARKR